MIRTLPRWTARAFVLALLVLLGVGVLLAPASFAQSSAETGTNSTTLRVEEARSDGSGEQSVLGPAIRGKSAVLINAADGRVLFERDADVRRPIASTTKIMTGVLALETLTLDRRVKASKRADNAGESEIWLTPGEELSVQDLIYALLVKSANDAAVALAEASAGTVEAFVEMMNAKAKELGLSNTHFTNPHGLDGKEHYSSARDLAILGQYAMANPEFRRVVALDEVQIPWAGRDYNRVLENRNGLIGEVPFVNGVKTGYTGKAGFCLVGSGAKDGLEMVSVILGEAKKTELYDDTVALLEWGFGRYKDLTFTEKDVVLAELSVPYYIDRKLQLLSKDSLSRKVYVDDKIERSLTVAEGLVLPVRKGDVLGKITYVAGGRSVGEVELVAAEDIEAATLGVKARYYWARFLAWMGNIV